MLKKAIAFLVMIVAALAFQSPAFAKGSGGGKSGASSSKAAPSKGARKNEHPAQGTGNYKGKRDDHEKPGPQNEKKKKKSNWLSLKKKK